MAKRKATTPQSYPRIEDESNRYYGYLDDSILKQHIYKIPKKELIKFIKAAIDYANSKSGRVILKIPDNATEKILRDIYTKKGKELFGYFKRYCGDPASTAYDLKGKNYKEVCKQQFYNRTLQKERMNSGWRYQRLAFDCANNSKRFISVSDIGTAEADFNAVIAYINGKKTVSLYVSVKNRINTMGGQDWPKAIYALENFANYDKNRKGPYCCVFGISMERGLRTIKYQQQTKRPYSINTEIWKADYFWPFFSNYGYEEIMSLVLLTLEESQESKAAQTIDIPDLLIETFGDCCKRKKLINNEGIFYDPHLLVKFFCS